MLWKIITYDPDGRTTDVLRGSTSVLSPRISTCREDVHGLFEFPSAPLVVIGQIHQRRILVALSGKHASIHEPLWCDVARSPSGRVEEVVEVGGVVLRQVCGLEAGEVCEQHPVPAGHHHVLRLDVAVADAGFVGLVDSIEDLKGQPTLLHIVEEWPSAYAVVQVVPDVLTEQDGGFLSQGGFLEG